MATKPRPAPAPVAVAPAPTPAPAPAPTPAPAPAPPPQPAVPPEVNVIYFALGSAEISVDAKVILESIVDFLKSAPEERVTLSSFADPQGSAAKNKELLTARSAAVRQFFLDSEIAAERVEIPPNYAKKPPKGFPVDKYWFLRKVEVNYSSKARELAVAKARDEDLQAENDAAPEPRPAPKREHNETVAETNEAGKPLEKLDVLYWKSVNHSLFIIAKAMGYFRDEGFIVRLHEASALEASQISYEVAEGMGQQYGKSIGNMDTKRKYFMGAVCPYGFHEALAKQVPMVQIGSMLESPQTIIMKKELAEAVRKDLRAFRGHSMARRKNTKTNIDYTLLFLNPLKALNVEYTEKWYKSGWDIEQALLRGEVDAMYAGPPVDQEFVTQHPEYGIFELRGIYPNMSCCRQLVTREQLKDKKTRDKYVRFERALIRAHKYYLEHKSEAAELVAKAIHQKASTIRQVFLRKGYTLDPNPNVKGAVSFYNTLKSTIGKQDINESIDTSVYEEALLGLAKQNPSEQYFSQAVKRYRATN